ncbi:MAG: DUF503 domain-containing protein [Thermodesulfobacteriota bacterium]
MVAGLCRISLRLHGNASLKGKRRIVKSIKERVRSSFNVSIAEVAELDTLQRAEIGVGAVGNDRAFINSVIDKVIDKIEGLNTAEIIESRIEIINM